MSSMHEDLHRIAERIHETNKEKGFWDEGIEGKNIAESIALIHSELSEMLEAHRKNKFFNGDSPSGEGENDDERITDWKKQFEERVKDTFEDEMADTFIRLLDISYAFDIDILHHIEMKMTYNELRDYKHNKNY